MQIPHPSEGRVGSHAEEQPADVGVEKALGNVVRVFVVIHKFVMPTMVRAPAQGRAFKGGGTKQERVNLYRPCGCEREVREEPMVTERDTHRRGDEEEEKHRELKPIKSESPEVSGHAKKGGEEGADEEAAVEPVDVFPGKINHRM